MEMQRIQAVLDAAHKLGEEIAAANVAKPRRRKMVAEAELLAAITAMKRGSPVYCGLRRRDPPRAR